MTIVNSKLRTTRKIDYKTYGTSSLPNALSEYLPVLCPSFSGDGAGWCSHGVFHSISLAHGGLRHNSFYDNRGTTKGARGIQCGHAEQGDDSHPTPAVSGQHRTSSHASEGRPFGNLGLVFLELPP